MTSTSLTTYTGTMFKACHDTSLHCSYQKLSHDITNLHSKSTKKYMNRFSQVNLPKSISVFKWPFVNLSCDNTNNTTRAAACRRPLSCVILVIKSKSWNLVAPWQNFYPPNRGYCFRFVCLSVRLSVCLSVCPRRFVRNFVRLTPSRVFNAQERNLYHMKALDEEHVMAPLVFRYRQYLRQKWRLKYAVLRFLCFLCAQLLLGFPTHANKTYIT